MPRTDFDFVLGRWNVRNRRRRSGQDASTAEWDEFDSTGEHRPLLGGGGNIEEYETAELPGVGVFHGMALRLHDPGSDLWRIWWSSSAAPGRLDAPLVGRFDGTQGRFTGRDTVDGQEVAVRFIWDDLGDGHARWQQAFSHDGGQTWDTNWVMEMTRRS